MSTNAFRNTTLFKTIPWQTTTPETMDPTCLPQEAQRFREALMQAEQLGIADELERFCLTSETNQDQVLDLGQSLKDYSTSASERGYICSSILQHRIIDMLSWKKQGLQRNAPTGVTTRRRPLPSMSHLPIAQLKHWFKIPINAKASLDAFIEPPIPLPNSSDASRAFMHLSRMARTGQKANLLKIMNNIDAASIHLTYLLEGNLELPESLATFTRHMLHQNPKIAPQTIVDVMNKFDMARLRVPLLTAITISPLCLITNAVLMDRSISEEKFCKIWWAQGSNRPSLLQEVEYEILGIVWDNATQSIDLQARLQQTLPRIISRLKQNIHDPALHWFNNTIMFNAIGPAPLPIAPAETATPDPRLERREEEEEEEEEEEDPAKVANEEELKAQEGHAAGTAVYRRYGRTQAGDRNDVSNDKESGPSCSSADIQSTDQMAAQDENPLSKDDAEVRDENLLSPDEVTDHHYLDPQIGWNVESGWRVTTECQWEDYGGYMFINFGKENDEQDYEDVDKEGDKRDNEDDEMGEREATKGDIVKGLMMDIFDGPETEDDTVQAVNDGDDDQLAKKDSTDKDDDELTDDSDEEDVASSPIDKSASTRKGSSQHPSQGSTATGKQTRRSSRISTSESSNALDLPSLTPPSKKRKTTEEIRDKKPVSKAGNTRISSIGPIKFISPQSPNYEVIDLTWEREKDAIVAKELNGVTAEKKHIAPAHTIFPLGGEKPESHEARFHFSADAKWYHRMMLAAEKSYVNGKPRYIESPETSAIRIITMEDFNKMSDGDVQVALSRQHLVVTGGPKQPHGFTLPCLETLGSLQKPILIHDMSEPVDDDYNTRHRSGRLSDMYKASILPQGKALNSLDFPMDFAVHPPTSFATDVKAWTKTDGPENKSEIYPVKNMRWGLAATSGAYHKWHIDADGDGTYVGVQAGRKVWFFGVPKSRGEFAQFASRNLYFGKYSMDKANLHEWNVEAVLLTPGTCLIMRPNTPHAVYTPDSCMCHGGHFLSKSTIPDTCYAGFHSLVLSTVITNADNTKSVRLLLRRMMEFFAQIITKKCLQLEEDWVSKSDLEHVPDITSFKGLHEIVTLHNFMELSNITNAKLYGGGNTNRDRRAAIEGRKISRSLIEIIFCRFQLVDENNNPIPSHESFILPYLVQQVKCLLAYKYEAEKTGAHSSDASCTYDAMVIAVRRHFIGDSQFVAAFNKCEKYETFAWEGPTWSLERRPIPLQPIEHTGKTYDDSLWLKEKVKIIDKLPELVFPWEAKGPKESGGKGDHTGPSGDDDQPPQKKRRHE